jgi:protein-disulfide isomerase
MSEEIQIKKETLWKIATFVFAALFLVSLFYNQPEAIGNVAGDTEVRDIPPPTQAPPTSQIKVEIDDSDPVLGDEGADITIVEFSDFQCPFCQRAFDGAIASLKQSDLFKNGEVNLVYKHFPLNSIHPQAQKAAEASVCAQKQGKFWEMHDKIFANQGQLDVNSLKTYAAELGLNSGQFNSCLDSGEATGKVNTDTKQATDAGGRGTPYFVIVNKDGDTVAVSGAQPWPNFESAIRSLQ